MSLYIFLDSKKLSFKNSIYVIVVFVIFIVMVLWEAISIIAAMKKEKQDKQADEPADASSDGKAVWWKDRKVVLLTGMVIFLILMKVFGFFTAGFCSYLLITYLLGTRKPVELFVIPVAILAFIYVIFVMLFHISLPSGLLI